MTSKVIVRQREKVDVERVMGEHFEGKSGKVCKKKGGNKN